MGFGSVDTAAVTENVEKFVVCSLWFVVSPALRSVINHKRQTTNHKQQTCYILQPI